MFLALIFLQSYFGTNFYGILILTRPHRNNNTCKLIYTVLWVKRLKSLNIKLLHHSACGEHCLNGVPVGLLAPSDLVRILRIGKTKLQGVPLTSESKYLSVKNHHFFGRIFSLFLLRRRIFAFAIKFASLIYEGAILRRCK